MGGTAGPYASPGPTTGPYAGDVARFDSTEREFEVRVMHAAQHCLDAGADVDAVVMALHNCHAETLLELDETHSGSDTPGGNR